MRLLNIVLRGHLQSQMDAYIIFASGCGHPTAKAFGYIWWPPPILLLGIRLHYF